MDERRYEYSEMVKFMVNMENSLNAYESNEYESALHNALNALESAVSVYLSIVNDYPYSERQFNFAREILGMIDREHTKIEMDFDARETKVMIDKE